MVSLQQARVYHTHDTRHNSDTDGNEQHTKNSHRYETGRGIKKKKAKEEEEKNNTQGEGEGEEEKRCGLRSYSKMGMKLSILVLLRWAMHSAIHTMLRISCSFSFMYA